MIELGLSRGRNAMAIWQELVDTCGFAIHTARVRVCRLRLRSNAAHGRYVDGSKPIVIRHNDYGQRPAGSGGQPNLWFFIARSVQKTSAKCLREQTLLPCGGHCAGKGYYVVDLS